MNPVLTPLQMRETEKRFFRETETPSIDLMERAATEILQVMNFCNLTIGKTVYIACGMGGNGGDGLALARMLAKTGASVTCVLCADESEYLPESDAGVNLARARALGKIRFVDIERALHLETPNVWVDAIFGIGLSRPVEGNIAQLISAIMRQRSLGAKVVGVDIPSGLDGTSGKILGCAVICDITCTFQCAKLGHYLGDGPDVCGKLFIRNIGIPDHLLPAGSAHLMQPEDIKGSLPLRRRNSYKNQFGHLLIVAGSRGMAGAALLCARAAMRSGVGLVTIACPESIVPILQTGVPTAMCLPLPEEDGAISDLAASVLQPALLDKTACAIGPGLSLRASSQILRVVLEANIPTVIDADGLNLLAQNPDLLKIMHEKVLITPHPGEAARLLQRPLTDSVTDARELHEKTISTVILKGATSVIYGTHALLSTSGTNGMAKGGSGDVLTGICGALIAQRLTIETAARIADEAHGMAGEFAAEEFGCMYQSAEDLIHSLSKVWKQFS